MAPNRSDATPTLVGTSEAADRLKLDPSTISRWVKEGRMTPAMRLPGRTGVMLFTPDEIARVEADLRGGEAA